MNIIKILTLSLVLCFTVIPQVHAEIDLKNTDEETTFDISVDRIFKDENSGLVQFNFDFENMINPQNIGYYRVLTDCDDSMIIAVATSTVDACTTPVRIDALVNNSLPIYFKNKTDKLKKFSFRVKAYDARGKWLHTEKKSFLWN